MATALLPPSIAGAPSAAPSGSAHPAAGTGGSGTLDDGPLLTHAPTPTSSATVTTAPATTTRAATAPATTAPATTAPSKTTPAPARASTADTREAQVVEIVNRERAANGCGAVSINAKLTTAARLHSEDQASHHNMSHTGSDGSSPWDRAGRAGYPKAIGENVAAGYRTPAAVMEGWMNSPGHRANILNCAAKAIGVGVAAAGDGTLYWTQMFGSLA